MGSQWSVGPRSIGYFDSPGPDPSGPRLRTRTGAKKGGLSQRPPFLARLSGSTVAVARRRGSALNVCCPEWKGEFHQQLELPKEISVIKKKSCSPGVSRCP